MTRHYSTRASPQVIREREELAAEEASRQFAKTFVSDVMEWARRADVGSRVTYGVRTRLCMERPAALRSAMEASDEGLVFLAQRRRGREFEYEATRISRPVAERLKLVEKRRGK